MERWSATPVFVLGALIPALALVAIAGLPKIFAQPTGGESVRLSVFAVLVPVLALACVSASFGGLSSLLPIAISERAAVAGVVLATASGSMLVGRYSAGLIADRLGSGRTLAPALASSTIGLVLFAINVDGGSTPVLFCAAVLFGLGGFGGAVQNESLVMAFQLPARGNSDPPARSGTSATTPAPESVHWRWDSWPRLPATHGCSRSPR